MRRLLLAALLLTLAGCGSAAAAPADPSDPVGWWQVEGTDQQVLIDPTAIEVVDGCATYAGSWRANGEARFVATVETIQPCPDVQDVPAAPAWIAAAGAFRSDGDARVLLDRSGAEVARLVPAPAFTGSGSVDPARSGTAPQQAVPVPDSLRPADGAALAGAWVSGPGSVDFAADGTWSGSDGCNGAGGSWAVGDGGGFVAVAGSVSTLLGCDGPTVDVGAQLSGASRAALDGETLVLLDAAGAETGRFTRS